MEKGEETFRVGAFLDVLNESFIGMRVSVCGEVSGVEERRGVTYFSLKDPEEEAMISCLIFRNDFLQQGVSLQNGQSVIVEGSPNVWKPRGRLSFRVSVVRLAGEGALKRAYDELYGKLRHEGMFSDDRKRPLPKFPERIALLTSREGAAIGDFTANLGRHGFRVSLFDAHVEGKRALADLVEGIRFFNRNPERWDVLVIIRGGGSLESLEAFNAELLVREIALSRIPILAGIGHEKDVSLAALVADKMVSTPTAVARTLGISWDEMFEEFRVLEYVLFESFRKMLDHGRDRMRETGDFFSGVLGGMLTRFRSAEEMWRRSVFVFSREFLEIRKRCDGLWKSIERFFAPMPLRIGGLMTNVFSGIQRAGPRSILARGYGLFRKNGKIVRSVSSVATGDMLEAILADGNIRANVKDVIPTEQ